MRRGRLVQKESVAASALGRHSPVFCPGRPTSPCPTWARSGNRLPNQGPKTAKDHQVPSASAANRPSTTAACWPSGSCCTAPAVRRHARCRCGPRRYVQQSAWTALAAPTQRKRGPLVRLPRRLPLGILMTWPLRGSTKTFSSVLEEGEDASRAFRCGVARVAGVRAAVRHSGAPLSCRGTTRVPEGCLAKGCTPHGQRLASI